MNRFCFLALVLAVVCGHAQRVSAQEKTLYIALLIDGHKDSKKLGICAAVSQLVKELGDNDHLGSWLVADDTKSLSPNTVADANGRQNSISAIAGCRQTASSRDLSKALKFALVHLKAYSGMPGVPVLVVVLGSSDTRDANALSGTIVAEAKSVGAKIHIVSVGKKTDQSTIKMLADQLGATTYEAPTATDLWAVVDTLTVNINGLRVEAQPAPAEKPEVKVPKTPPSAEVADKSKSSDGSEAASSSVNIKPVKEADSTDNSEERQDSESSDSSENVEAELDDKSPAQNPESSEEKTKKGGGAWLWWAIGGGVGGLLFLAFTVVLWRRKRGRSRPVPEADQWESSDSNSSFDANHYFEDSSDRRPVETEEVHEAQVDRKPAVMQTNMEGGSVRFVPLSQSHSEFEIAMGGAVITVGRKKANNVVLRHKGVSGMHAEICWMDGHLTVVDKGSTNGTYVNDQRVRGRPLNSGDVVRFDSIGFRVAGRTSTGRAIPEELAAAEIGATTALPADEIQPLIEDDTDAVEENRSSENREPLALNHHFCLKHKNRISTRLCEGCTRPYCSECLIQVLDEYLCHRCRDPNDAEA